MDRIWALWGQLPTTQVRITVTLGAVIATTARYVLSSTWEPSYEWLGFLVLMSGVDAAQWLAKRTTDHTYVATKLGTPPPPPGTD